MEALARINLGAHESRALWFLMRKTLGWQKESDWISASQFRAGLGLDRRHVHRALAHLAWRKMIVIQKDDKKRPFYSFQADFRLWNLSCDKMTANRTPRMPRKDSGKAQSSSSLQAQTVIPTDAKVSSRQAHTKENLQKDFIYKSILTKAARARAPLKEDPDKDPEKIRLQREAESRKNLAEQKRLLLGEQL
jgi:phage replication O-like protein O